MKQCIELSSILPQWTKKNNPSAMEKLISCAGKTDFISFALGLPAMEFFPREIFQKIINSIFTDNKIEILQYAPPCSELKLHIINLMRARGINCTEREILITSGAQQGIHILSKLFLESHKSLIIEEMAYPGMLQAIQSYEPTILTVPTDNKTGMCTEEVEKILCSGAKPAFLYVVTEGGNPCAASISEEKRKHLGELANKYGLPIIEDDPYSFLTYEKPCPPIKFYGGDWVCYVGSFSKIFAPSLRIGWIIAPEKIIPILSSIKESIDINSATFSHYILNKYLNENNILSHIDMLKHEYAMRRDNMIVAIQNNFPIEINYHIPSAGIFLWATIDKKIHTTHLLDEAIKNGVAFIPSESFSASHKTCTTNGMRFNFSHSDPGKIEKGIKRLSIALENMLTKIS